MFVPMTWLGRAAAGRRWKWLFLAAWLAAAALAAGGAGALSGRTTNDQESFLPAGSPAREAAAVLAAAQPRAGVQALIVFARAGGLTGRDLIAVKAAQERLRAVKGVQAVTAPGAPGEGTEGAGKASGGLKPAGPGSDAVKLPPALLLAASLSAQPQDGQAVSRQVKALRSALQDITASSPGLRSYVTGAAGITADLAGVFSGIDGKLLAATVLLVLVLLLAIYRAPLVAFAPLVTVGVSYTVASGILDAMAKAGMTISTQSTSLLVVLMFGAGTDYCLLLTARYREELRARPDKHEAMQAALAGAGPAILASGLTVTLAMLCLLAADLGSTRTLGPVAAVGVATTMLASLTMLPALMAAFGRAGFWPSRKAVAFQGPTAPGGRADAAGRPGLWMRWSHWVLARPWPVLGACTLVLGAGAIGLTGYQQNTDLLSSFRTATQATDGIRALRAAYPAGVLSPTTLIVKRAGGLPATPAQARQAARAALSVRGVDAARPGPMLPGGLATVTVVLDGSPYGQGAMNALASLRGRLDAHPPPGTRVLAAGDTAVQLDTSRAAARDLRVIVPLVLLVIFVILALLLRALAAPGFLIATVILSFLATLGISLTVFEWALPSSGVSPGLLVMAFLFLVALGVDYNIFLMHRVHQEARRLPLRQAVTAALDSTGAVITSAGLILAGTFAVLCTLPLTFLFQIGFLVSFGVLLDTFVVRTCMVPAITEILGRWSWWPSRMSRRDRQPRPDAGADADTVA